MKRLPHRQSPKYTKDFAYISLVHRLPQIITKIINDCHVSVTMEKNKGNNELVVGIKKFISIVTEIRYHLMTNKTISLFTSVENPPDSTKSRDLCHNVNQAYNLYIEKFTTLPKWFETSWIFIECYCYALINNAIEQSNLSGSYDVFSLAKESSYVDSLVSIRSIVKMVTPMLTSDPCYADPQQLDKLIQLSLWGNKFDLSISSGSSNSNDNKNPWNSLDDLKDKIIANDIKEAIDDFLNLIASKDEVMIDIVLDNSGYELMVDLILAVYLATRVPLISSSTRRTTVRLRGKCMPWFVSDVTQKDFTWTLKQIHEDPEMEQFDKLLAGLMHDGTIVFTTDAFWSSPFTLQDMNSVAGSLYKELAASNYLIFKGDLNYRKLVDDRKWTGDCSFVECLTCRGPWHNRTCDADSFEAGVLALRTVKCESVAGVDGRVLDDMRARSPLDWFSSGQYGMIQYAGGPCINQHLRANKDKEHDSALSTLPSASTSGLHPTPQTTANLEDPTRVSQVLSYIYEKSEKEE